MTQIAKLFITCGFAALISATSFAQDNTMGTSLLNGPSYMSNLHTFNLEGDTLRKNLSGSVVVDLDKKQINLSVSSKITHCPRAMMCIQIIGAIKTNIIETSLPLVEQFTNDCGETTYQAKQDLRNVNGNLSTITVTDRSHSTCGTSLNAQTLTEVVYESEENLTGHRLNATFGGNKLQVLYKLQPVVELQ